MKYIDHILVVAVIVPFLLFYFAIQNPITEISAASQFGLFSELPLVAFFALVSSFILLVLSLFYGKRKSSFLVVFFIFILILFGFSILGESLPRVNDVYWHVSAINQLIEQHYASSPIDLSTYSQSTMVEFFSAFKESYLSNNPGSFILGAFLILLTGVGNIKLENLNLISFASVLLLFIYFLWTYLLLEKVIKSEFFARLALILFAIGNVYIQYHQSPQAWGLIFFTVSLFFFIQEERKKFKGIFLVFAILTIFVHLPSALFLILVTISLDLILFVLTKKFVRFNYFREQVLVLLSYLIYILVYILRIFNAYIILFCSILLVLMVYLFIKGSIISALLTRFKVFIRKYYPILFIICYLVFMYLLRSWLVEDLSLGRILRLIFLALSLLLGLLIIFYGIKKESEEMNLFLGLSFLITSMVFFVLQEFFASSFQIQDRVYMIFVYFGILSCIYFLQSIYKTSLYKLILLGVFMLFLINCSTLYYLESHSLINNQYLQGWDYLASNSQERDTILGSDEFYIRFLIAEDYLEIKRYAEIDQSLILNLDQYDYVVVSNYFESSSKLYEFTEEYSILVNEISNRWNVIYSNPSLEVYHSNNLSS